MTGPTSARATQPRPLEPAQASSLTLDDYYKRQRSALRTYLSVIPSADSTCDCSPPTTHTRSAVLSWLIPPPPPFWTESALWSAPRSAKTCAAAGVPTTTQKASTTFEAAQRSSALPHSHQCR